MSNQDSSTREVPWDFSPREVVRKLQFLFATNHVTVQQLAERTGIPKKNVQDILDGVALPTEAMLHKCAEFFGVSLDFVMGRFYGDIFFAGKVDERYKQLARLRLSQIHGCRTCNKQNVPGAMSAGFTDAQIAAMDTPNGDLFTDAELAVLEFAEQMALTNHDGKVDETLYRRLSTHFSDAEICELGTVMAVIAGMVISIGGIGIGRDIKFCCFPACKP